MPNREVLKLHAGLVDRMATKLGVDLQEAAIDGDVSIDQLSDAVLNCTDCPNPGHCQRFLDQPTQAWPVRRNTAAIRNCLAGLPPSDRRVRCRISERS